jgi:outer membrane protein
MEARMKYSVIAAVVLSVALTASFAAAEMKIGFINSEEIFQRYEATKDAQDKFNKEVAKWEQEASDKQKAMKDMKEQLEKQSLLLSSERKKEIESQLQQKMIEYQEFLQSKFGQKGEALVKNEELTKPIVEKINTIIEKIAKDEGYDYIFDARGGGVVFAKKTYDLTERVISLLNKGQ